MPERTRVTEFIKLVEAGQTVQALEQFYTPEASQQENQAPPRAGLRHLILHEKKMLSRVQDLRLHVRNWLLDGDQVILNYIVEGSTRAGRFQFEELALQRWDNERIIEERFFYDPAQREVQSTAAASIES